MLEIVLSIIIPFVGTFIGSMCIYFIKKMNDGLMRAFAGFAGGVMIAASIWSLLIPSLEYSSHMGTFAFIPAVVGLIIGFLFLMLLDKIIPHMHVNSDEQEGPKTNLKKSTMTSLAVALHNLPEGIAVGVVLASSQIVESNVSIMMAVSLAIGIAIQNFPEGAIVSVSLSSSGVEKNKSFLMGVLSGVVEPLAALITFFIAGVIYPVLPYLLSFAAGAMIYVVIEELIPEMTKGKHSHIGTIFFGLGFILMLILEVVLN